MKQDPIRQVVFPILAALIWGTAFVAQDVCADTIGAFTFNAARYGHRRAGAAGAVGGAQRRA